MKSISLLASAMLCTSSTTALQINSTSKRKRTSFVRLHHTDPSRIESSQQQDVSTSSSCIVNSSNRNSIINSSSIIDSSTNSNFRMSRRKVISLGASISLSSSLKPLPSQALSPKEASSSYDTYASSYDDLDGGSAASALGIDQARSDLLKLARGNVLEVGVGTGLNVDKYVFGPISNGGDDGGGVRSLTLVDISEGMLEEARSKVERLRREGVIPESVNVSFVRLDATSDLEALLGDKHKEEEEEKEHLFDTVVDTFSLCVMGEVGARSCLRQMRNVVKSSSDGGQILLIENTRSSNPVLGIYQDATAENAAKLGGKGCVYNQNVTSFLRQTDGLTIVSERPFAAGLFRSFICTRN